MSHPDDRQIALYACGDTGWTERFLLGRHICRCIACRERANAYRRDREAVQSQAAALPPNLNWERLAGEMTANIRVGLEAGQCVGSGHSQPHRMTWRPVLAAAGLASVLISGWYLNFPAEQRTSLLRGMGNAWSLRTGRVADRGVSLEATRNGIQVSENGSTLTMMHPGTAPAVVVVSTQGSLRARYVDDDTGQVTITNVYSQ